MKRAHRFGVVIVNYGTPGLSIDAALSAVGAGAAHVALVDNASPDGSLDTLRRIVGGEENHEPAAPEDCREDEVRFASLADVRPAFLEEGEAPPPGVNLSIISSRANGGFSAGVNLGLVALMKCDVDYFLALNPDAVLAADALDAFADRLADRSVGLCGATVLDFTAPHLVQAFGGARMNRLLLVGANIGDRARAVDAPKRETVEAALDYPLGAAMACRRDYIGAAGLLDERYFLYYEEADWARAGGASYRVGWADGARVYHRYGASSKSARRAGNRASMRSPLSDFHMVRSRILYARKRSPGHAALATLAGAAQSIVRVARGRFANARAILRASLAGVAARS